MPSLIVKSPKLRRYAGKVLTVGETFEATDKHAKLFKRAHLAADAPPGPAKFAALQTQATAAEPAPDDAARRRNYRRRDMKAEG